MRKRREELGMLLVELARKLERSPAAISMFEGGFVPKPRTQVQIAEALGTTPEKLWPAEWEAA